MKFRIPGQPPQRKEGEEFTSQLLYLIGKRFAAWYIPSLRLPGCACMGIRWVPQVLTPSR